MNKKAGTILEVIIIILLIFMCYKLGYIPFIGGVLK